MKNLWNDADANAAVRRYRRTGASRDLALRIYTSRLMGGNRALVVHGGGNSSVKQTADEITGDRLDALYIKGSGWDMAEIEPPGFPALRMDRLSALRNLSAFRDEDMRQALQAAKLDHDAPSPSVETLLHAFIPAKFVDHTHANAVLAVTNQRDGAARCRRIFGDRAAVVPYVMSGFELARTVADAYDANPGIDGIIVPMHGIFTFGDSAKQSYGRMIDLVNLAERHIRAGKKKPFTVRALPKRRINIAEVAPILRGLLGADPANGTGLRPILDFRTNRLIRDFVDGRQVARYGRAGTATPDHVIHTKPTPVILPAPVVGELEMFREQATGAIAEFGTAYKNYLRTNSRRRRQSMPTIDLFPRVILLPGHGLFGVGETAATAAIAADIAEVNVETITDAERIGRFHGLDQKHVFDIEFWSLERAKLSASSPPPLAGRVVLVTGGGSGIGAATARVFSDAGAELVVLDLDGQAAEQVANEIGGIGLACDVTDKVAVRRAFEIACKARGGVDIVISNAGAAWQGEIGTLDENVLRKSFELNFWAHQTIAQNAVRVMRAQGMGGVLLFNASKQAVNPGKDFGPYGLPKAATLFLMRQYALDHGKDGIRANAINADRIRSGLLNEDMIALRSRARGLSEADYMGGNLLGREVTAKDVAKAFLSLALSEKTTAATLTVDGGNIEASLR